MNMKNWGWACEGIVAIDVVTASGDLIRVDAQQNSDLLWAAKGGGPIFPGVATRFHLQTRPAPRVMRSSGYVYPLKHYRAAFDWALKVRRGKPNLSSGCLTDRNRSLPHSKTALR